MASALQRSLCCVAFLALPCALAIYAVLMLKNDWNYFALEKQISTWQTELPPTMNEVSVLLRQIKLPAKGNPNLLRMQAIALEWKAFLDQDSQRFYLSEAEESLLKAIVLRPTDSRNWAHLALIKSKLARSREDIKYCYLKAKSMGAGDVQTIKILAKVLAS